MSENNRDWPIAEVVHEDYEKHAADERTQVFIQWKGTDVCFDMTCDCGFDGHFDGFFAYQIECPGCHAIWLMPYTVYPLKIPAQNDSAMVTPDDDGWQIDEPALGADTSRDAK